MTACRAAAAPAITAVLVTLCVVATTGCDRDDLGGALRTAVAKAHARKPRAPKPAAAPAAPEPYGKEVTSLRLRRSIVVRLTPDENGKAIGTVAQDTRVGWKKVAAGPGCERWVQITPRGWVCDRYLEPTSKAAAGVELPKLKEGELVPGTFARVTKDGADAFKSVTDAEKAKPSRHLVPGIKVRKADVEVVDGKLFWKTTEGELIEYGRLALLEPSRFVGVDLRDEGARKLPFAWVRKPKGDATAPLRPRTIVAVRDVSEGGKTVVTDKGTFARGQLHLALPTAPPPTTLDDEKWFDVDLDEQVVVAYEGTRPVYATLISSGSKKWPTPAGIYRVWIKFAETDMNGQMGDEDPYSVATVPWTMFFAKDLAFHTAYWHDAFGEPRSHGCLNLSPRDARALYFWASPEVPAGWSMAHGIVEAPGALVRVRSAKTPEPEFMGYAKRVYEARLARAGGASK